MLFVPRTLRTVEEIQERVEMYLEQDAFAFDVETKATARGSAVSKHNALTWISLAAYGLCDAIPIAHEHGEIDVPAHTETYRIPDPKGAIYKMDGKYGKKGDIKMVTRQRTVPATYHPPPKQPLLGDVLEALRPLFFSDRVKVAHNAKFDLSTMSRAFREQVPAPWADTVGVHHLLNENHRSFRLDNLVKQLYGSAYPKIGADKPHLAPFSEAAKYALRDAKWAWFLYDQFIEEIDVQGLSPVWQLEMEDLAVVMAMEDVGVPVNEDALKDLSKELRRQIVAAESAVLKDAGRQLNLNATTDKAWYVYEHRGHQAFAFTKKKNEPSTEAKILKVYAERDPMVARMLEYSDLNKMLGTYAEGLQKHLLEGRLHASFKPFGTVTGRFSCADPNLQNIPRVSEDNDADSVARGRLIRKMFMAPEGFKVVVADYDQVEYRLLAHIAKDTRMIEAFNQGIDPHTGTAAALLRKDPKDVTKEERQRYGKTINFATLYGAQAAKVAESAGVSKAKGQRFLDDFWVQFPEAAEWKRQTLQDARSHRPPHVTTLFGRRRRLPELFYADDKARAKAERQAINSVIQGSAADLVKMAMVRFHRASQGTPHQLVLSVHDELVVFSPEEHVEEGMAMLEEAMIGDQFLSVPLLAEASYADTWGDAK